MVRPETRRRRRSETETRETETRRRTGDGSKDSSEGCSVHKLRLTYDESVGKDIWYFYLDRGTCAMVGHRLYHDKSPQATASTPC